MSLMPSASTLCIGGDLSWWGGKKQDPSSQCDHLFYGVVSPNGSITEFGQQAVDLSSAVSATPPSRFEPNRDPEGKRTIEVIVQLCERFESAVSYQLIALDAPLEADKRPGEKPRVKSPRKGEKTGARRRDCETELKDYLSSHGGCWKGGMKIQAGAPLFPRVSCIVKGLESQGVCLNAPGRRTDSNIDLIEIFPSEAISLLGLAGYYGDKCDADVLRYKKGPVFPTEQDAKRVALAPLTGFVGILGDNLAPIVDDIADKACRAARREGGKKASYYQSGKAFDDRVDAGIAFLTSVCFALGQFHCWGDGSDGLIVGPGTLKRDQ